MTRDNADRIVTLLLATGGIAAAFFIMKNPSSRRKVLRALKVLTTDTIPGYVLGEAARAWREAGDRAA